MKLLIDMCRMSASCTHISTLLHALAALSTTSFQLQPNLPSTSYTKPELTPASGEIIYAEYVTKAQGRTQELGERGVSNTNIDEGRGWRQGCPQVFRKEGARIGTFNCREYVVCSRPIKPAGGGVLFAFGRLNQQIQLLGGGCCQLSANACM